MLGLTPSKPWIPLVLLIHFATAGWASHHEPSPSPWTVGVVQELKLEGNFFGLLTRGGKKLLPMHLPEEFKKDGLAVRFRYRELKNVVTIRMWGTSVAVSEIEVLELPESSPEKAPHEGLSPES